ncbi:MAG: protein-disulfide reductase DsbD family protein, partial [Verrucomicrobiales bacterium]
GQQFAIVGDNGEGAAATLSVAGDALRLVLSLPESFVGDPAGIYFFPETGGLVAPGAAQVFRATASGLEGTLERIAPAKPIPATLAGVLYHPQGFGNLGPALALTVASASASDGKSTAAPPGTGGEVTLLTALLFAFLGGLILNLMPCVFPVISLKIMSFVNQAGEDRRIVSLHGLFFTLGVLISFWILAGALIALRYTGAQLGWGFQLQEPAFVMFMSGLLLLLALSLFGVFEIGVGLTGAGGKLTTGSGFGSSFWSGALATLLATPCAAPFMGPAVGFALVQPPLFSLLVFTVLALGMSLPYLLLSLFPGLLRFVPRPGAWMETFSQMMGFPMLAVVIWLLWVLGLQIGIHGLTLHLGTLFLLALAGWVYGRFATPLRTVLCRRVATVAALLLALAAIAFSAKASTFQATTAAGQHQRWIPYSAQKVEQLLAEGRPVFIDFTAAWCLTCQANKIALHNERVLDAVEAGNIALVEADWTNRDASITKALAKHGRASVPLYLLYDPAEPGKPRVLPQILTPAILLEAFRELAQMPPI